MRGETYWNIVTWFLWSLSSAASNYCQIEEDSTSSPRPKIGAVSDPISLLLCHCDQLGYKAAILSTLATLRILACHATAGLSVVLRLLCCHCRAQLASQAARSLLLGPTQLLGCHATNAGLRNAPVIFFFFNFQGFFCKTAECPKFIEKISLASIGFQPMDLDICIWGVWVANSS